MIIFRNPGLIDLLAATTLGVSIKAPDAFGRFGTGIKYGVATVLRGGGTIRIYRGKTCHEFTVERVPVGSGERAREFDFVCLDGVRIGITTELGRDWKPWMTLREFGCNALDEDGEFWAVTDERPFPDLDDDHTVIAIEWAELDTAYKQRANLFLEGEPLFANDKVRILPGPSAHLFYRGIRVFKTEKPSHFTYDILAEQLLTEDRTLVGSYVVDNLLRDTILGLDDVELVRQAVTTGDEYHESKLDFAHPSWGVEPSSQFLRAVTAAREGDEKEKVSQSARSVVAKAARAQLAEERTRTRIDRTSFTDAISGLFELGIVFADDQKFIETNDLPGEAKSMFENGAIYMLRSLMNGDSRAIGLELIKRWVDLQPGIYGIDATVALLAPMLLDAVPDMKRQRLHEEKLAEIRAEQEAARVAAAAPPEVPPAPVSDADDAPVC